MNYTQAVEWIHARPRMPKKSGLEKMRDLLEKLGNPQDSLRFIHVAGTNGKGSTVTMCASVLQQAGYKVGANISPYVLEFRERFQVNGVMIGEEEFAELASLVKNASEELEEPVLEFEAVTAVAFLYFMKSNCDIVCLETGLGGRLDATNVIKKPLVACIMRIGLDHTEILGDTLEKIAAEKCGIIKEGGVVVTYPTQPPQVMQVITQKVEQMHSTLILPEVDDIHFFKGSAFENRIDYGGYYINLPFLGKHQAYNASVVVETMLALEQFGFTISDEDIIAGIENATFPARIEIVSKSPLVILDGAHNEDSVQALTETLQLAGVKNLSLVFGGLKDKDITEILCLLSPYVSKLYAVTVESPRAMPAREITERASRYISQAFVKESIEEAIQEARAQKNSGVLICGSLYLASQAREILKAEGYFENE